jgi:hypothetical protein
MPRDNEAEPQTDKASSGKPEAFRTSGGRAAKQSQLIVAVFTQVIAGKPSLIAVHESPPLFDPKSFPLRVPK